MFDIEMISSSFSWFEDGHVEQGLRKWSLAITGKVAPPLFRLPKNFSSLNCRRSNSRSEGMMSITERVGISSGV